MNTNYCVAKRTEKLLKTLGKSWYWLKKQTGMPQGTLNRISNNKNRDICFSTIVRISQAFGMEVKEFVDDEYFGKNFLEAE